MLLKALGSDPNVRPKPSEILESQWFKTQAERGFGGFWGRVGRSLFGICRGMVVLFWGNGVVFVLLFCCLYNKGDFSLC